MSSISASRSWNNRVHRDVKIVFDLFVETLQGGVPGQPYVVNYQRGAKEKGTSEPMNAGPDGSVNFKYHKSFVSTLQRKNETSYKRKEFRLWITEHPSGYIVSDLIYDLSGPVENEVFPNKKLMVKSPNGQSKLLFCLSGISEEDYIHLMSDKANLQRSRSVGSSGLMSRQTSMAATAHAEDQEDNEDDDAASFQHSINTSQVKGRKDPDPPPPPPVSHQPAVRHQSDEDDEDLGELVETAVAQVSGRRGGNTPSQSVNQRSESPAPRPAAAQPAAPVTAGGTTKSTAPPESRPPPSAALAAPPPPPTAVPQRTATVTPQVARSHSPSIAAPPQEPSEQPQSVQVRSDVARSAAHHEAVPEAVSLDQAPLEAPPLPASKSSHRSGAAPIPTTETAPRHPDRSASIATTVASSRNEKEVEKYLSEMNAAVLSMAGDTPSIDAMPTNASTGLHTFNVAGGAKTASSIPRAALLALHCLNYWSGIRRTMFLHDFLSMVFVDVVPHTRHAAQWMNVLLHVLFHTLTQGDDADAMYDPLSEDEAVQLSDDLTQCILDAEECGYGSRNRFMCRSSRDDRLFVLIPKDGASDDTVNSPQVLPMHPGASIILTIGLDEALRRLSVAASSAAFADIERFCFPPPCAPTRHTNNGYLYSGPVNGSASGFSTPYGVGGGGPDHVTEDAAFSVVLNALNRLFLGLHGVTKTHPSGASALLRLTGAELFKIIFRNINNILLNNIVAKDHNGNPKSRVRTVDDAMNLKLALSMFESWLQEHQLFIAARSELLACRQVCDLIILHKRLLMNIELSDEVTSALSPDMVVFLLEHYQPNKSDYPVDTIPADVLASFKRLAEEKARSAPSRGRKALNSAAGAPAPLQTRSLGTFPFLDFVSSLIPFQDEEDVTSGVQRRKSLRSSIVAASKVKAEVDTNNSGSQNVPVPAEQRTLDWDHSDNRLTYLRNREAFLGVSVTHDAEGKQLTSVESKDAQARLGLRVIALSVADEDVIRRMVV